MAHIRKYKRILFIGCSHGAYLDRKAFDSVMKFKREFKPDTRVHLGDIHDYTAFRGGAVGTRDEAEALGPDIAAGARMIQEYEPTDVLIGNHDQRVWSMAKHPNAIIAHAAACCRNEFLTACEKAKVKRLVDHYNSRRSWLKFGDCTALHGFGRGGENSLRDSAEHFGKCVVAHFHTPGIAHARRSDNAVGYCVGLLADPQKLEYAATLRTYARWNAGLVYGEYSNTDCHLNLSERGADGRWVLPI